MPDTLLIRIDENVKSLIKAREEDRQAFLAHVAHDAKVTEDYLKPLWEESQQRKGAEKLALGLYTSVSAVVAMAVSWVATRHL